MKRTVILLFFVVAIINASAIPAKRIKKEITTTNGTTIKATLTGDEKLHFWLGDDGKKYFLNADNKYEEFESEEFEAYKSRAIRKQSRLNSTRTKRSQALRKNTNSNFTGSKKGLVILVNFNDVKINAANTQAEFYDQFNKVGYNKGGHIGSVHDYFKDQSYGVFDLSFDVVGPVTVSKNMSYYGRNIGEDDAHPGEMVIEACKLVDSQVNFKDYDWDGDGYVDQVYVIFAGYTEAQGGSENSIWAHEWTLNECKEEFNDGTGILTLDNIKINTYACSSELRGYSGNIISPIGTACHEFSHCLGYYDVYDVDYSGGFAMDAWDIMSSGNYNGPYGYGEVPSGFTAYERNLAGWLDYKVLDKGQKITDMAPLCEKPEAYIIYNDANKNEYYILENRQLTGWDSYQYGHGMLVVHVDYDATAWAMNEINDDPDHQRYNIIPADNQFMTGYEADYGYYATMEDLEGDPFPGTKNIRALTDTSTPAAKLFNNNVDNRKYMGKPIENITETNKLISFTFMGGVDIQAPTAEEATNIKKDAFTARWSPVEKAESYTIELSEKTQDTPENNIVLAEDFSGFSTYTSDGSTDISSSLNKYMKENGWTGYKVYTSPKRVKIGSSQTNGYLITPSINVPASGTLTVAITAKSYSTNNVTTKINNESITITPDEKTYVVHLKDVSSSMSIKIAPTARIYISQVNVYDGVFSLEDLTSETAVGNTQTITGITDTCYTFTNLHGDCYRYKVKAVNSEGESQWSKLVTVDLTTAQLTGDINQDGNINIGDLTQLISLVMSSYSTKDDLFNRANINNDDRINVGDVTQLISLIMSFKAKP